jgi:hypothetical protein
MRRRKPPSLRSHGPCHERIHERSEQFFVQERAAALGLEHAGLAVTLLRKVDHRAILRQAATSTGAEERSRGMFRDQAIHGFDDPPSDATRNCGRPGARSEPQDRLRDDHAENRPAGLSGERSSAKGIVVLRHLQGNTSGTRISTRHS